MGSTVKAIMMGQASELTEEQIVQFEKDADDFSKDLEFSL